MRLGSGADTGYSDTYYLWIYFGLGAASIVLQVGLLGCCLRGLGQSDPKHVCSLAHMTVAEGQIYHGPGCDVGQIAWGNLSGPLGLFCRRPLQLDFYYFPDLLGHQVTLQDQDAASGGMHIWLSGLVAMFGSVTAPQTRPHYLAASSLQSVWACPE